MQLLIDLMVKHRWKKESYLNLLKYESNLEKQLKKVHEFARNKLLLSSVRMKVRF